MNKLISSLIVLVALGQTGLAADRPNILFMMADDHTYQAIGAYGSRLAKLNPTPVIDSLARGGMRFDRVFCNSDISTATSAA